MTNPREDITIAYTLSWGTNFHIRCQFLQPTCKKSCSACTNAKWTMLWLSIRLCHSIQTSQEKIHTISYTHGTDRVARIVFREFYLHKINVFLENVSYQYVSATVLLCSILKPVSPRILETLCESLHRRSEMLKDNMYSMVDHTQESVCIQQQAIRVSQDSKSPSSTPILDLTGPMKRFLQRKLLKYWILSDLVIMPNCNHKNISPSKYVCKIHGVAMHM